MYSTIKELAVKIDISIGTMDRAFHKDLNLLKKEACLMHQKLTAAQTMRYYEHIVNTISTEEFLAAFNMWLELYKSVSK